MEDDISFDPPLEYAPYLLTTLDRVAARAGGDIITQEEVNLAYEMILSASLEATSLGNETWTLETAPMSVKAIVTQAATRGVMNPEGLRSEGTEAVSIDRGASYTKGADLTLEERRRVKAAAGRSGFTAVSASKPAHWTARSMGVRGDDTVYVPWTEQVGPKPFPFGSTREFEGG